MKNFKIHSILGAACLLIFAACSSEPDFVQKPGQPGDSVQKARPASYPADPGMIGVYDVPEMIVLSKMDSAAAKDMSFQLGKNYSALQEDMMDIGAEMVSSPGVINYNNDAKNLKFECILVIREIPKKQPSQSAVVVLEASKMLLYNHYGPYQDLGKSYAEIRKLLVENELVQSGPMREFYVTDPTTENDPKKWLTRVMIPVDEAKDMK